jgi:hypothetical protein
MRLTAISRSSLLANGSSGDPSIFNPSEEMGEFKSSKRTVSQLWMID